jgi:hypothetical protein
MKTATQWMEEWFPKDDYPNWPIVLTKTHITVIQKDALQSAWDWLALSDSDFRLRMGECTAQEIRTCRAMLRAILGSPINQPNQQPDNHV